MPRSALQSWYALKCKRRYWRLHLTLLISLLFSLLIVFNLKSFDLNLILQSIFDQVPKGQQQAKTVSQDSTQAAIQTSIQTLQTALYKQPDNVQLATQLARYYLQQSKDKGHDRDLYLFLAQETLQLWWDQSNPPLEVLSLRAYLYQAQHQFSLARADLQLLLKKNPRHPNAAFSLAMLQQIQGDYAAALQSCRSLLVTRQLMLSTLCQASIKSVSGQAKKSYAILNILLKQMSANDQWRQWTLATLADTASRLGKIDAAEHYFQQALAIPSQDAYLKVRYADFLLTQQRANDLLQQFSSIAEDKQLLLRQSYAAQLLHKNANRQDFQDYATHLKRYVSTQQQQSQKKPAQYKQHAALWAYYYLNIDPQPQKALLFANMNWQHQKSNQDLHLLLHAALLTQDNKTLNTVKNWRKKTALEDIVLEHLLSIKKLL